ncbi:MAG: hypothetical protein K8W52_17255 [Deltaproteobacteria bacterium]|nr:hypothetical protein [Deltaproteobacteria bacterium]
MRGRDHHALAALGLAGCLSAPTGQAPVDAASGLAWPPPGANIVAHVSADLDGDGLDDVLALDATSGRIYVLRGGAGHDVDPSRATVTTVTRSAALAGLAGPAAVAVIAYQSVRRVVILDTPTAGARLTVLGADLAPISTTMLAVARPAANATVSLTPSAFGMSGAALFGTVPDGAFFIEASEAAKGTPMIPGVPSTGGTAFNDVMAAGGYITRTGTPTPRIFVSERTLAQRSDAQGGNFAFTSLRPAGPGWSPQVVDDITGDQLPDVIGFDGNGNGNALLCAIDVESATLPTCFQTPFGMDAATMVVGPALATGQRDVVLVSKSPTSGDVSVFVVPDLHVSGAALAADNPGPPGSFPVDSPTMSLAQLDTGPLEVLLVGKDGAIVCVHARTGPSVTCDQP